MRKYILILTILFASATCCDFLQPAKAQEICEENMNMIASSISDQSPLSSISDLKSPVNVLDFGADPTGKRDSTDAIQNACRKNRHVYFPAGIYLVTSLSFGGSITLQGSGNNTTVIKTTELTGNVFTFRGDGWHVADMKFDAVHNRTDGAYIFSTSNYASIRNVSFDRHYIGIDLDGSWTVDIENVIAFDGTPESEAIGGAMIRLGNNAYTGPIHIRGLSAKTSDATRQPSSCITMGWVDVVSISDALIIWHKKNIIISPDRNQFAALIEVTNSCFDTAKNGIYVKPTNGARVLRCGFANTWFGAHQEGEGMVIDGTEGSVTGLQFTNCMFMFNRGNGVSIFGENVNGIYFSNCFSSANVGNGLDIRQQAKNIKWLGGGIGASHEGNGNTKYGYFVEPGCTGSIMCTDLTGNGMGVTNDVMDSFTTLGNTTGR